MVVVPQRFGDRVNPHIHLHALATDGAIARPQEIIFNSDLPKTRSGKIMRRLLRDIATGKVLGDTTALASPAVVERLKKQYEETEVKETTPVAWRFNMPAIGCTA